MEEREDTEDSSKLRAVYLIRHNFSNAKPSLRLWTAWGAAHGWTREQFGIGLSSHRFYFSAV